MTRIAALCLLALLPLAPAVAVGPPSSKPDPALALDARIIADVKKSSEVMANLTYLSDEIGPRLTGSNALVKANKWTAEKMAPFATMADHGDSVRRKIPRMAPRKRLSSSSATITAESRSWGSFSHSSTFFHR